MKGHCAAIVLAAGRGKRMNSSVQKQYLLIKDKPVLYYSLMEFEICPFIEEVILVTGEEDIVFCRKEIIEPYGITKVTRIIPGGAERYHSVFEGLKSLEECSYVYIHDGARPFIDQELLSRVKNEVEKYPACVVGMPVKDTIKISDGEGFAATTPDRSSVWMVQTPQVFAYDMIFAAYERLMREEHITVTDDAMVLETVVGKKAKLVLGSYQNIKITTPEDLLIAEVLCKG